MMCRLFAVGLVFVGCLVASPWAAEATMIRRDTEGELSAEARFTIIGDQLQIILTNTSTTSPRTQDTLLTGICFMLPDDVTLTPVSAYASDVVQEAEAVPRLGTADVSGSDVNVGGEFHYRSDTWDWMRNINQGIASAQYIDSESNPTGNLNGPVLNGRPGIDGADFGLVNEGFVDYSGNGGLDGKPLISNSVIFLLDIQGVLPESGIRRVRFAFGPGNSPPTVIPEPTALALLLVGAGLGVARRRRRV